MRTKKVEGSDDVLVMLSLQHFDQLKVISIGLKEIKK